VKKVGENRGGVGSAPVFALFPADVQFRKHAPLLFQYATSDRNSLQSRFPVSEVSILESGIESGFRFLERLSNRYNPTGFLEGGFYFHPSDEDLSLGTPLRKKPLGSMDSVYSHSENAIAGDQTGTPRTGCPSMHGVVRRWVFEATAAVKR